ncbi:MAG: preprotein translocase subunit YajC [Alphaproteobacteria bacterium RIFCSPLOWO2_01_FULL_40_26]|nr:MAG: preprotein translocase subunit YajC [Alphaproteobacteria bacterium RIFCSPHIGHO2_02_FULL_40_34]OFW86487.1 MAG: preprotein translocase subunit YajC [Alphaproteobacteria bacterium RIFCSPHIGHO2_01_FULL_40_8]OFW95453.1 MAG: preprotein translocase subunit YajC [Alphaproteobacteria bacterium RIFCSPLOWO2_01_FULL_40_26]OFX10258.1 MAG: preprotein translocase subunit YajC [Alphaproteobacteria bacterium RIFCSPLOWO2_02_FULL_40_19]OFX11511.1 MAG: preprotein translocase subunit YajC [Alphaproteobacter
MFISKAFAQATESAAQSEFSFSSFVPLLLIFAIFYFLIIRPQSKKMKDHQEMVNNLKSGNKVITNGGIIGVVKDIFEKENQVEVEIADGVRIRVLKQYVAELVKDEKEKVRKS